MKVGAQTPDVLDGVEILARLRGKRGSAGELTGVRPLLLWEADDLKARFKGDSVMIRDAKTPKIRRGGQVTKRGSDIRRRKKEVTKFSERSKQPQFSQSEEKRDV